ncbi:MAG: TlpA disulfide reductase family protein [Bacteroidota bacterium]
MKKLLLSGFIALSALSAKAQQIAPYTATELMERASSPDTCYIINFWATWCLPCVAELHEFNTLEKKFKGKPVKVLLVSLDFKEDYASGKLEGFVKRKRLASQVVWLAETDPNIFIPQIDNSWQGSIPATVMIYSGRNQRRFIEGPITAGKLKHIAEGWMK